MSFIHTGNEVLCNVDCNMFMSYIYIHSYFLCLLSIHIHDEFLAYFSGRKVTSSTRKRRACWFLSLQLYTSKLNKTQFLGSWKRFRVLRDIMQIELLNNAVFMSLLLLQCFFLFAYIVMSF